MSIFLKFLGKSVALNLTKNIKQQIQSIFTLIKINYSELIFICEGKSIKSFENIQKDNTIHVYIPLLGGKGGFGAKLKNQGGKKVKPNDNMFSRDANGRRIVYASMQKDYIQHVKKKIDQDQKVNHQREQFKIMQDTIKQGQSFMKLDKAYNQEVEQTQTKMTESIRIGRLRLLEKRKIQQQKQKQDYGEQKKEVIYQAQKQEKQDRIYQKQSHEIEYKQVEQKKQIDQYDILSKSVKKIKTEVQVRPVPSIFSNGISAKDKLKSLFKK